MNLFYVQLYKVYYWVYYAIWTIEWACRKGAENIRHPCLCLIHNNHCATYFHFPAFTHKSKVGKCSVQGWVKVVLQLWACKTVNSYITSYKLLYYFPYEQLFTIQQKIQSNYLLIYYVFLKTVPKVNSESHTSIFPPRHQCSVHKNEGP